MWHLSDLLAPTVNKLLHRKGICKDTLDWPWNPYSKAPELLHKNLLIKLLKNTQLCWVQLVSKWAVEVFQRLESSHWLSYPFCTDWCLALPIAGRPLLLELHLLRAVRALTTRRQSTCGAWKTLWSPCNHSFCFASTIQRLSH